MKQDGQQTDLHSKFLGGQEGPDVSFADHTPPAPHLSPYIGTFLESKPLGTLYFTTGRRQDIAQVTCPRQSLLDCETQSDVNPT
jgi:hypothetical protein